MEKLYLFEGKFNWYGENGKAFHLWRHARTEKHAFLLFTRKLAKTVGRRVSFVRLYFNGTTDNYKITKKGEKK